MAIGDWPAAGWPFVRAQLPAPPALVSDVRCGPEGGFVLMLAAAGYQATGVDPEAPEGPGYRRLSSSATSHRGGCMPWSRLRRCTMSPTWA